MLRFILISLIFMHLLVTSASFGADAKEAIVDLGGIRKVQAKITTKNQFLRHRGVDAPGACL